MVADTIRALTDAVDKVGLVAVLTIFIVCMLIGILMAAWKIVWWMRDKVVEPVVKSHLDLIATMKEHIPKQTDAINAQSAEISTQTEKIDTQNKLLEKRSDLFDKIIGTQEDIVKLIGKNAVAKKD